MKGLKKYMAGILVAGMVLGSAAVPAPVYATEAEDAQEDNGDDVEITLDDKPYLALGADLTADQQHTVLSYMGIEAADFDKYDVVYVSNAEEHQYLDSYVPKKQIGTKALSSVLVSLADSGNGLKVSTYNINYCTAGMYKNALATAGVEDANVIVAGPFPLSGTAALVGTFEAYEKLKHTSYDGVVLDVNMPRMDGLQLLEKLQKEGIRANVVMVSTLTDSREADVTILAMERGAIDFVAKPTNIIEAKGEAFKRQLLGILNAVLATQKTAGGIRVAAKPAAKAPIMRKATGGKNKLVALACSTGGPKALQSVIPFLPKELDAPVVLVQHMPPGFTKSMADRLDDLSKIRVKEAEHGERLQKGCVYIAPGGKHLKVAKPADGNNSIVLDDATPAIGGLKPCANLMYDSLTASSYDEIVCVVLTGMGADGTNGILSLGRSKPIRVIAQNEETCVVYGMPKAIYEAGVVDEVVPLDEVAQTITKNVGVK